MKIRLIGPRNNLGVGIHFACFADTIKQVSGIGHLVEEIDCFDQAAMLAAAETSADDDVNICFVSIDLQDHFRGTNCQWIVFESTVVPEIIMSTLIRADLVWVPSNWGQQVLVANGLPTNKVDVVPEGVDVLRYHSFGPRPRRSRVRFLTVGKFEHRKSQRELLTAWARAMAHRNAELVIKTFSFFDADARAQELLDLIKTLNLDNVGVYWGALEPDSMIELYKSADAFVLASKGEGWGLPLIEAAAMGVPVIATRYSGHEHYLKMIDSSVVPVDFDMVPVDCQDYRRCYPSANGNWGQWAQPRVASLAQALVHTYSNLYELQHLAAHNADIVRKEFSWCRSVDQALMSLQQRGLLVSAH